MSVSSAWWRARAGSGGGTGPPVWSCRRKASVRPGRCAHCSTRSCRRAPTPRCASTARVTFWASLRSTTSSLIWLTPARRFHSEVGLARRQRRQDRALLNAAHSHDIGVASARHGGGGAARHRRPSAAAGPPPHLCDHQHSFLHFLHRAVRLLFFLPPP